MGISGVFSGPGRHRRPTQTDRAVTAATVAGAGLALPLLTATGAHAAPASTWDTVAQCETGSDWVAQNGDGYYGGLHFTQDNWVDYGGDQFAAQASHATKAQQITVAERLLADQGPSVWGTCATVAGLTAPATSTPTTPVTGTPAPTTPTTPAPTDPSTPSAPTTPAPPATPTTPPVTSPVTTPAPVSGTPTTAPPTSGVTPPATGTPTTAPTTTPAPATPSTPTTAAPAPGTPTAAPTTQTPGIPAQPTAPGATAAPSAPGTVPSRPPTQACTPPAGTATTPGSATSAPGAPSTANGTGYTVQSGDNLWDIAQSHHVADWQQLYQDNVGTVGTNPDLIYPGQQLQLP